MVRQEPKVKPILKKIHKQQLKWFGHLMRMNDSRPVKKVWQARMTEKRKRGRPRKTRENSIADFKRKKMLHEMRRQLRKYDTGKNGQDLYKNKRNNT